MLSGGGVKGLAMAGWLSVTDGRWVVAAVVAAGGLILLHWLGRGRRRRVVFPAVRFVQRTGAAGWQRDRLRRIVVVLLRAAAVGLVLLSFAGLSWKGQEKAAEGAGRYVILVLDCSASMKSLEGGLRVFDIARSRAAEVLKGLEAGRDRASLVLMAGRAGVAVSELTGNPAYLRGRLGALEPGDGVGDGAEAMRMARRLAERERERGWEGVEVHVFSDLQRSNWPVGEGSGLGVVWHGVGRARPNGAIRGVRLEPAVLRAGRRAEVVADLVLFEPGKQGQRRAEVLAEIDGMVQRQVMDLEAGKVQQVRFAIQPEQRGWKKVTLRLEAGWDSLAVDNEGGLFFQVDRGRRVWLVGFEQGRVERSAGFYLAGALAPEGAKEGAVDGVTGIELKYLEPRELKDLMAGAVGPQVLIVDGLAELGKWEVEMLRRYVEEGGGLLWVADEPGAARAVERVLEREGKRRAGGRGWEGGVGVGGGGAGRIGQVMWEHPVLEVFQGASRGELVRMRLGTVVEWMVPAGWQVLIQSEEDKPVLAVGAVGRGRVAVLSARIVGEGADVVRRVCFAPLVHELVQFLAGEVGEERVIAGEVVRVRLGKELKGDEAVVGPGGLVGWSAGARADELVVGPVSESGIYEIRQGQELVEGFWVGVDERESDAAAVADWWKERPAGPREADVMGRKAAGREGGREVALWPYLVAGAMAALVVEHMVLVGVAGRWWPRAAGGNRRS